MNACIIAYTHYKNDFRVRRYAEVLARRGYRVDVIAARKSLGDPVREVVNSVNVCRIVRRTKNENRFLRYSINIFLFFVLGTLYLIWSNLKRHYDVIHIHNMPDVLVFMAALPKLFGSKVILDIHDVMPELYCQRKNISFDSLWTKGLLFLERISVRYADHVIIANEVWRKKILQRTGVSGQSCTAILNYVSTRLFYDVRSPTNSRDLKIVYPGTASYLHGLDVTVRALALIKRELPSVEYHAFTQTMSDEYRTFILELTRSLDLEKNVFFHGLIPIEELRERIAFADMAVVSKRPGIFSSEAFSTKTLELMASGIPLVVSRTDIDEFYFDETMITFFEPENHEELARCILDLHFNRDRLEQQVEKAKAFTMVNNWEAKQHMYLDIIGGLCRTRE